MTEKLKNTTLQKYDKILMLLERIIDEFNPNISFNIGTNQKQTNIKLDFLLGEARYSIFLVFDCICTTSDYNITAILKHCFYTCKKYRGTIVEERVAPLKIDNKDINLTSVFIDLLDDNNIEHLLIKIDSDYEPR